MIVISIGASLLACRTLGRHIVALEEDSEIFKLILEPLLATSKKQQASSSTLPSEDPEDDVVVLESIPKRSRFSK